MGINVVPIGKHDLDTSDIHSLAKDLSSRLDINIVYGYYAVKEEFDLLGLEKDDDYVELGAIFKDKNFKEFKLTDMNYVKKELMKKHGLSIINSEKYLNYYFDGNPPQDIVSTEKKILEYPEYELENFPNHESMTIYKEYHFNEIPYYSKWQVFCQLFSYQYYKDIEYLNDFNDFREQLMKYSKPIGADKLYYINDHRVEGVGSGAQWDASWSEVEQLIKNETSKSMLDIPKFLTQEKYRKELFCEEEILSFIDDFSDLKG